MATNDIILSREQADGSFQELVVPQSTLISGGFRNVLINGDFRVNQRNITTVSAGSAEYFFDRWYGNASLGNITSSASGAGNQINIPNGASNMQQIIEAGNIVGGTYVLSWEGTATATVNSTSVANGGTIVIAANTQTAVLFTNGTVAKAQLELGTIATPFEQRSIGLELSLCQRYYQTAGSGFTAVANSASNAYITGPLRVQMRATPTLAITTTTAQLTFPNVGVFNASSGTASISVNTATGITLLLSGFSGMTAQTSGFLNSGDIITADAEL